MLNAFPEDAYAVVEGWSAVEAAGPDAGKFLQNFCTNDVLKLVEGRSCEAMFTDVKAHVIAYAWVSRIGPERFVLLLASERAETLRAHLDRYLLREDAELKLIPPGAWKISNRRTDDWNVPVAAFGEGCVASVLREPPDDRRLLPAEEFEALRIRLGVPRDGVDVDDRNLPQEVDRNEAAISFTKGCYLGQEPVARIDALGRVNWLLRGLTIDGPAPAAGSELTSQGKAVGRITSATATAGGAIALAYLRRGHTAGGTELLCGGVTASVRELPPSDESTGPPP